MAEIQDGSLELEIIRMQADSKVQEQVSKSKVEIQAKIAAADAKIREGKQRQLKDLVDSIGDLENLSR